VEEFNLNPAFIERVLSKLDGLEFLMGDIIRVLCLYLGRLWLSELVSELEGFRRTLGTPLIPSASEVERAVNELAKAGIVEVEERLKSVLLTGSMPDLMVKLRNYNRVLDFVRRDQRYNKYVELRERAFRDISRL